MGSKTKRAVLIVLFSLAVSLCFATSAVFADDEKSAVSVEFGEKHTELAQAALTAITTDEEYKYKDYGMLEASLEGSVLTIQFPKAGAKEYDAMDYVDTVLDDMLDPSEGIDKDEKLYYSAVGKDKVSDYDDEDEVYYEWEKAKKKDLGSSLSLNVLWATKATYADFTVSAPLCGSKIEIIEISEGWLTHKEQSPTPEVSNGKDSKLVVTGMTEAYWLNRTVDEPFDIRRYVNWFEGSVQAGDAYNAAFIAIPSFGYFVDENDMPEVSVNGDADAIKVMEYNGDCVVQASVKAEHDWGNGEVTTQPTETTPGVMTYKCKNHDVCGGEKTKEIPAGSEMKSVEVNVKTLDDEGNEDTSANGGTVIPSSATFVPGDKLSFDVEAEDGYTLHSIEPNEDDEDIDGEYKGGKLTLTIPDDYEGGNITLNVVFAPKCNVYIDFGYPYYVREFIKYIQDEYKDDSVKRDPDNDNRVIMEVSKVYTKGDLANALYMIAYGMKDYRKGEYYYWIPLLGFGEKDAPDKYSNRAQWEAEKEDTTRLKDGMTYYSLWNEEIEKVDVTIEPPKCGDSSKFADPYEEYSSQTNPPKATLKSTEQYDFVTGDRFKTAWVKEGPAGIEPAEYDFKAGEKYRAEIQLEPKFGYIFTDDTEYTFNGEPVDEYNIAGPDELELLGDIAVTEHLWDKGTVTKKPTATEDGERQYKCKNFDVCGGHYEEVIPKDSDPDDKTPSKTSLDGAKVNNSLGIKGSSVATSATMKKKTMSVKWKKVAGATNYLFAYKEAAAKTWTEKWTAGKNSFNITKMKANGLYDFKVLAVKKTAFGWQKSNWSKVNYRFFQTVKQKPKAGKKRITVKVKKVKKASGYEVLYSLKKTGTKKVKVFKGIKKTKLVVTKLKKGKKYFVQSRPYKKYKGHKYIGVLTNVKKVRVK